MTHQPRMISDSNDNTVMVDHVVAWSRLVSTTDEVWDGEKSVPKESTQVAMSSGAIITLDMSVRMFTQAMELSIQKNQRDRSIAKGPGARPAWAKTPDNFS